MYFDSEAIYILSKKDAAAKITAIDNCITALLDSVLISVGTANLEEYMLNDGQTIIKSVYRSPQAVIQSVETLRMLRQQYINDINPRMVRMVDGKNFWKRWF